MSKNANGKGSVYFNRSNQAWIGEVGIYKSVLSQGRRFYYVDKTVSLNMSLSVYYIKYKGVDLSDDSNLVFTYGPSEKQWWITGFNPRYQNIKAKDLKLCCAIFFENTDMYDCFYEKVSSTSKYQKYWLFILHPIASTAILVL